jgi:ABC-type polysaccharide/polyol phosphate export permease
MEFERRFAGSALGKGWMFLSPLLTIGVIGIALSLGTGLRASAGQTYGLELVVGLAAWLFFTEAVNGAVGTIVGSPHLVKKVVFPVALLPISTVLAAFIVHLALLGLIAVVVAVQQGGFGWSILTLPFWSVCLLLFAGTTGMALAGLNVVSRDVTALAPNAVSLVFWLTPIVWPLANVPADWRWLVLLNPMTIILEGYRHAMIIGPQGVTLPVALTFAAALVAYVVGGLVVFHRLRRFLADAL